MQRALLTGLTIGFVVSCSGPAARPGSAAGAQIPPAERARMQAELEPFEPAFESLDAALRARDEVLARRILARIQARDPRGAARERAQAYERILEGREWVAGITIHLDARRAPPGDEWIVRATATNTSGAALELRGAPPTLWLSLIGVTPTGMEQRYSQRTALDELASWRLDPGVETVWDVGRFAIPLGGALAVRALFSLEFLPGEVLRGDEKRPATNVPVARCEVVRLASFLPSEAVEPEELARYVREELIRTPPLLERAVRIAPEQRGRALDLLTPAVLELPSGELEKVTVALRWLSGQSDLGADARSWRQWLDERARRRAREEREGREAPSALELPDRPAYRQ